MFYIKMISIRRKKTYTDLVNITVPAFLQSLTPFESSSFLLSSYQINH